MRIGFILTDAGWAAVLYARRSPDGVLVGATKRSPWFPGPGAATAYGVDWGKQLGIGVDVVRVDTRLLERAS